MSNLAAAPGDRYVPWLDVFPKGCLLKPVKYVCAINARSLPETTDPGTEFRYVDISNVDSDGNWVASEPIRFGDSPSRARRVVADGDVIVSTVRTYLRAIAHIDRVEEPTICSTGFAVLSANGEVLSKFLAYWARSVYFVDEVVARSVGVSYPAVNAPDLGNIPCPVLSPKEQRAIAGLLDRETARIDALIEKKSRQIALLHEKRAALISHAVTKGLDPAVQMKDSCVAWLDEIPAHWTVQRLMTLTPPYRQIMYGIVLPGPDVEGGFPIVKAGNVAPGKLRRDFLKCTAPEIEAPFARARLNAGDLVFAIRGSIGSVEIVPEDVSGANITQDVARVAPASGVDSTWLRFALESSSVQEQVASATLGATVRGLNIFDLKRLYVPVPPPDEQRLVAEWLCSRVGRISTMVAMIETSLDRLREYRTALISAAVTGKIDVRQEVT